MRRGLTSAQVAEVCGVDPATVRSWIKRGHLTRDKYGRIDQAALLKYLDERGTRGQRRHAKLRGLN